MTMDETEDKPSVVYVYFTAYMRPPYPLAGVFPSEAAARAFCDKQDRLAGFTGNCNRWLIEPYSSPETRR